MTEPYVGPRCYAHAAPSFHGVTPGGPGLPAHVLDLASATCQRCPSPIVKGDRYLCDDGGIIHAECPATPDADDASEREVCGKPRRYFPQQTCYLPRGHEGDHEDDTHLWENDASASIGSTTRPATAMPKPAASTDASGALSEAERETIRALRREIGPLTERDHAWQPMVSAGEVRVLLDCIDRLARESAAATRARADERERVEMEACSVFGSHPRGGHNDAVLAASTGASGALSEAERMTLWAAMPAATTGAQEQGIYAAVERIVAARESAAATRARAEERERIAQAIEAEDCGTPTELAARVHQGCIDAGRWPAAECRACSAAAKAWHDGIEHMRADAARIARGDER